MAESPEIQGATNLDQDNIEEVEHERDYWHERFEAALARAGCLEKALRRIRDGRFAHHAGQRDAAEIARVALTPTQGVTDAHD